MDGEQFIPTIMLRLRMENSSIILEKNHKLQHLFYEGEDDNTNASKSS